MSPSRWRRSGEEQPGGIARIANIATLKTYLGCGGKTGRSRTGIKKLHPIPGKFCPKSLNFMRLLFSGHPQAKFTLLRVVIYLMTF
jgi:hypothetical protein